MAKVARRAAFSARSDDPLNRFEAHIPLNHVFLSRFPVSHPTHTASVPPTPLSPHSSTGILALLPASWGKTSHTAPNRLSSLSTKQQIAGERGCVLVFLCTPSSCLRLSAFERPLAFCISCARRDPGHLNTRLFVVDKECQMRAFVTCDSRAFPCSQRAVLLIFS